MGKQETSRKLYNIIKAAFISCFLTGVIGICFWADSRQEEEEEQAAVMAARRALDIEVEEAQPIMFIEQETQEEVAESTMEIVNGVILSDIPAADYSYSFEKQIDGARVVTRQGDYGGFNEGAYPEENTEKSPLFTEGIEGDAVYLDGSYGLELCDIAPLSDSYTISFWMKAEELYDWSPFLIIGSNLLDAGVTQNYVCFNKKTSEEGDAVVPIFNTVNATQAYSCEVRPSLEEKKCINLNEWNYITVRVDGTQASEEDSNLVTAYLYLNSEMIGSSNVCKLSFDGSSMKAYIGINCFDILFRACYDEIHIWNTLLDENQISSMYAAYNRG